MESYWMLSTELVEMAFPELQGFDEMAYLYRFQSYLVAPVSYRAFPLTLVVIAFVFFEQ
jgi:hypothetical protein